MRISSATMMSELGPVVTALAMGAFVLWLWWYRQSQLNIPGPKKWPLINCTIEVLSNWGRIHDWYCEQFSDDTRTFHLPLAYPLGAHVYTVDPANVEYILKTNFSNYRNDYVNGRPLGDLFGMSILTANGEAWKEQRRLYSFEFLSATLRDFSIVVFRDLSSKLVSHVARFASTAKAFDIQDLCMRMTLDSISKIGFDAELNCLAPSLPSVPFAECFDDANFFTFCRFSDPLWQLKRRLNLGRERKLNECMKVINDFTSNIIDRRRKLETAASTHQAVQPTRMDILSRFMENYTRNGAKSVYKDRALRDLILNFAIAGRDTTASTLTWFFYMMTCHPKVAHKINEEVSIATQQPAQHTGEVTEDAIEEFAKLLTYETIGELHYLQAALSETLRLYPAVPVNAKEAVEDDILPDGTVVKKGTLTAFLPYSMGRMKFIWGDDALEFKPERWLKDGLFQPDHLFKFLAFSGGPRQCIGKNYAYLSLKMTAALMLRFFALHLIPGHPVKFRPMIVLYMHHGLRVTATPHTSPQSNSPN